MLAYYRKCCNEVCKEVKIPQTQDPISSAEFVGGSSICLMLERRATMNGACYDASEKRSASSVVARDGSLWRSSSSCKQPVLLQV